MGKSKKGKQPSSNLKIAKVITNMITALSALITAIAYLISILN